jgi:hypothetical protein
MKINKIQFQTQQEEEARINAIEMKMENIHETKQIQPMDIHQTQFNHISTMQ